MPEPLINLIGARLEQLSNADSLTDSCRLLHGRGRCYDGYEQVAIDWYQPVVMLTVFKALDEDGEEQVQEQKLVDELIALCEQYSIGHLYLQRRYHRPASGEWLIGHKPESLMARRGGLQFNLDIESNQNTGFFLDIEPARVWLETLSANKNVLNLFSYTCAFSVVAAHLGADQVVNVDMSKGALSRGRENHRVNGLETDNIKFLGENILKSWSRIRKHGPYDLIIMDPPSFQKGSFIAQRDYGKLLRRIAELSAPDADILVCLNAPELSQAFVEELMATECPDAKLIERLSANPDFPDRDSDRQLKLFHFRYLPEAP